MNHHPQKRNKSGFIFLIIILLAGAGFVTWKYLLPMLNGDKTASTSTMKMPESANIKSTQKFGDIPINQFGIVLKEGMTASDAKKIASQVEGTITGELDLINFYQIETKTNSENEFYKVFDKLKQATGVEMAVSYTHLV